MKKFLKPLFTVLLLSVLLIPSISTKAAVKPATPSGLGLTQQQGSKFQLSCTFDNNLMIEGDLNNGTYTYFGYEATIKTLKGKKITTIDKNIIDNGYDTDFTIADDLSKIYLTVSNSKLKKQGFIFTVRSYVYNEDGSKLYSDSSKAKVIIPRASLKSKIMKYYSRSTANIKWDKVSGAKSYSVYVSKDGEKFKKKGTTTKCSYTLTNLKRVQKYYVYITANGVKKGKKKYNSTKPYIKSTNAKYFYY